MLIKPALLLFKSITDQSRNDLKYDTRYEKFLKVLKKPISYM